MKLRFWLLLCVIASLLLLVPFHHRLWNKQTEETAQPPILVFPEPNTPPTIKPAKQYSNIFAIVLSGTSIIHQKRKEAILNSWGKSFTSPSQIKFITDEKMDSISRLHQVLKDSVADISTSIDYILVVLDNTFVFLENLIAAASSLDKNSSWMMGHIIPNHCIFSQGRIDYLALRSGFVFSKTAFIQHAPNCAPSHAEIPDYKLFRSCFRGVPMITQVSEQFSSIHFLPKDTTIQQVIQQSTSHTLITLYGVEYYQMLSQETKETIRYNNEHILFVVNTLKNNHNTRTKSVKETWLQDTTHSLVISDEQGEGIQTLPSTKMNKIQQCAPQCPRHSSVDINWTIFQMKASEMIVYAYEEYFLKNENLHWIVMTDDDSYVFVSHIAEWTSAYDFNEPILFGHALPWTPNLISGAGFMMSRKLLETLYNARENCLLQYCSRCKPLDVHIGQCAHDVGVPAINLWEQIYMTHPKHYHGIELAAKPFIMHHLKPDDMYRIYNHYDQFVKETFFNTAIQKSF